MKTLRKALAFFLSLAMVIGVFAGAGLKLNVNASTNNKVTIYYNNSWGQAYIHYQQANGSWTSVPGEKMTSTSEVSGYKWKATIDLGSNSGTQVCFNDGNNTWDSQNGANYYVSTGTWGIKNGQKTTITSTPTPTELFTCDFDMDVTSPQTVGTTVKFTGHTYDMPYHMYDNFAYTVHKQGTDTSKDSYISAYKDYSTKPTSYIGSFKFTEAGTYDVTFNAMQYSGYTAKKTKTITINTVATPTPTVSTEKVLYFNNSVAKWDNVYAYVWNNSSDAKVFEAKVYDKVAKVYEVKITGSYKNVIFKNTKNTWDKQTVDLEIPTDYRNCYKANGTGNRPSGSWYGYSDKAFECTLTIGKSSPQKLGTAIPLYGETKDMPGHRYNSYFFMIHKVGTSESQDKRVFVSFYGTNGYTGEWNPTEEGTYEVSFYAQQYSGFTAVDTQTFVISK